MKKDREKELFIKHFNKNKHFQMLIWSCKNSECFICKKQLNEDIGDVAWHLFSTHGVSKELYF